MPGMDTVETRIVPAWSRVLYKQGEFLIYTDHRMQRHWPAMCVWL